MKNKKSEHITRPEFFKETGSIRSEIGLLRSEFFDETKLIRSELRGEMGLIRSELKGEISSLRVTHGSAIAKLQADVTEIKDTMATKIATKTDVGLILDRIDAFTLRIETYDRKAVVHDERFKDHEARITRLEHPS